MNILFPQTSRVHGARQELLLKELSNLASVRIADMSVFGGDMPSRSWAYAKEFDAYIRKGKTDLVIIRGDRYEMLPLAMICSYHNIPIAHIEGGDLSGVIDNKVRKAITALADLHFATNEESKNRLLSMGTDPEKTFNFGSLDCEYALSVIPKRTIQEPYILVLYHVIEGENPQELTEALIGIDRRIIGIKGNLDYGGTLYQEEYAPEEFVNLMRFADCIIGNSSAGIKEASVLGTPVVNIGSRQKGRLKPENVLDCECKTEAVRSAIESQISHGRYEPSNIYYQPQTSKKIAQEIIKYG